MVKILLFQIRTLLLNLSIIRCSSACKVKDSSNFQEWKNNCISLHFHLSNYAAFLSLDSAAAVGGGLCFTFFFLFPL